MPEACSPNHNKHFSFSVNQMRWEQLHQRSTIFTVTSSNNCTLMCFHTWALRTSTPVMQITVWLKLGTLYLLSPEGPLVFTTAEKWSLVFHHLNLGESKWQVPSLFKKKNKTKTHESLKYISVNDAIVESRHSSLWSESHSGTPVGDHVRLCHLWHHGVSSHLSTRVWSQRASL